MQFEGIVIRRTTYKEGAAMITVLTKDRLRSFLAKGVLKMTSKNAPSVNLFTKSLFQTFSGKDGEWLRLGEVLCSYPNITKSFENLAILDFISEITNTLIGSQECQNVYDFLLKTLENLNNIIAPLPTCLIYFAQVLKSAGYGLDIENRKLLSRGNEEELKIYNYIFNVKIDEINKIDLDSHKAKELIFKLCDFINLNSQIEFKSLTLLKEI